jgi:hypothetical protein
VKYIRLIFILIGTAPGSWTWRKEKWKRDESRRSREQRDYQE